MKPCRMNAELLAKAVALQRKGWTLERIAGEIGISRKTVGRKLARWNDAVAKRLLKRSMAQVGAQLGQFDWIIEESADAWLRSKRDVVTVKVSPEGVERTRKTQSGDPAKLRAMLEAMAGKRVVLGIDHRLDLERAKVEHLLGRGDDPSVRDAILEAEERDDGLLPNATPEQG
jgi:hypothetical protein